MNDNKDSLSNKELKAISRAQLLGKYNIAILVTLTVEILSYLVMMIELRVIGDNTAGYLTGLVIDFIVSLLFGVFTYGEAVFFLKLVRGENPLSVKYLFAGFSTVADKAILIKSVYAGISFLGLIPQVLMHFNLIIVPDEYYFFFAYGVLLLQMLLQFLTGLYLGLSYYILADHPEMSAKEILAESLKLMKNKKGKLFTAYLSLIPLCIVSICACGIGIFWFSVFLQTLLANFYLDVIGENGVFFPTDSPQDGSSI